VIVLAAPIAIIVTRSRRGGRWFRP
jgi:hypothetical protein